jgi:hypothetical protein
VPAAGKSRVLDFSALDADVEPVRVRSVENDDVSMLFLPFTGCAVPVAGTAPTPAARYRGGSILPAEAPPPQPRGSKFVAGGYEVPVEDTAFLMDALVVARRRRSKCPGTRIARPGCPSPRV